MTPAGRLIALEGTAFALTAVLALLARTPRRAPIRPLAVLPLLTAILAEGLRAHPHAASPLPGAALTVVHLLAASVWIGGLVHVLRVARRWRRQPGWTRLLVHDYARIALALVLVLVATGTLEAVLLLSSFAALVDTTYGVVLLVKLGFVAAVLALALLARRRLRHSPANQAGGLLGRAARAEPVVLAGVLAVTALLVSVAPPGPTTTELAAPPPPVGPVVPAGTLAGQITVIATASAGQLVLRMSTPGRADLGADAGDAAAPSAPADYRVAAQLAPAGQQTRTLGLRGCGSGCFTTPITWPTGANHLRLTIAAPPWHGGTADLPVSWPPHTDPAALPTALTAMRAVPRVTVHQAVTSDYAGNPGPEQFFTVSGADFLAGEFYGTGGGNPVVTTTDGDTEIRLAFPQGIAVRIVAGPDHRLLREEETTPNHLITSIFEYSP